MNRRTLWLLILGMGMLSLVVCAIFVVRDVMEFRRSVRDDFRASCRRRAITFEEFAEQWIVRDQLDSLNNAVKFLLMGDGLYADLYVQGELLLSERDEGWRVPQPQADELPPGTTIVDDLPDGDVEVRLPIVLTGYPENTFGLLRIGFSGSYAVSQVRGRVLKSAGVGIGSWAAGMLILVLAGWGVNRARRQTPTDEAVLSCGTLEIDTQACRVTLNGVVLDLNIPL